MLAEETVSIPQKEALHAVVSREEPVYSPIAKQMRVSGNVTVEVTIDATGHVEQCEAVTGNPLLTNPVIAAVKKWTFKPFIAGGKPSKALTRLTFSFGV